MKSILLLARGENINCTRFKLLACIHQTLDTYELSASTIVLEGVDSNGDVTHQDYHQHLSSLTHFDTVLDSLSATLRDIHLKLDGKTGGENFNVFITVMLE